MADESRPKKYTEQEIWNRVFDETNDEIDCDPE
jgi:hypothetical protein